MNLFYLDKDLDKLAEYHIDAHVGKMILECAQLMATTLWVDRLLGYVPRFLNTEELGIVKNVMVAEPEMEQRTFIPYKACHHNHPSAVWMRSSLENFYWAHNYANALQREGLYRGRAAHKSCEVINAYPEPTRLPDVGWTPPTPAMPDELKSGNTLEDYRLFYLLDKAPFAKWTRREKPFWWDEDIAMYSKRYTALTPSERRETGWL